MNDFLQTACTTAVLYESLRKVLIDEGQYQSALATYGRQQTFLPDENTGSFWDEKFNQDQVSHPMEEWRLSQVVAQLNLSQSLLNLGVGRGKLESLLDQKGFRGKYLGTDITQTTLNWLKKKFPRFTFASEELTGLSQKSNSFDQITLLEVLEHIKPNQTFAVLGEIHRVLKPQGTLIVSVPVNEGLEKMLPHNPNSHMRLYSESLLRFELQTAGFTVKNVLRASAFHRFFTVKNALNSILSFCKPNNLVFICTKK